MILCVLGTHPQPFDRAVDWLLSARGDRPVVIQHGATPPRTAPGVEWHESLPYDRVVELMESAEAIVCHAGVGTVISALGSGRRPIVIARRAELGEHVDDHQLQLARALSAEGSVDAADSPDSLRGALEASERGGGLDPARGEALRRAVWAAAGSGR